MTFVEFREFLAREKRLYDEADSRVTWSREKPSAPGVWFGAQWQRSGYYHVQRFGDKSLAYLRAMPCEYWFGPLTAEEAGEEWTRYIRCEEAAP